MPTKTEIMDALGTFLDGKIVDQLVSNGKLASSNLLNSITHQVNETLQGVEVVGTMIHYGRFVESGRKVGAKGVPVQVLMEWIRTKGIESDLTKSRSIAFAMQKTIKRKGIKPLPFIENAIRESVATADRLANDAMTEDIERELDIIFQIV